MTPRALAITRILVTVAAALVLMYLAWRSSPWLGELNWIPRNLSRWADRHGISRNIPAFFVFGLVCFTLLGRRWPHVLLAAFFATALEVAQLWIPHRFFDRKDIYASLLGVALAWIVVATFAKIFRSRRNPREIRPAPSTTKG